MTVRSVILVARMPASPPSRARRKDARPAELLAAALETFRARGFAATRIEDIAARAGVSKGTVYLYYPSKQAIFEALVRETLLPNLDRVEAMLAASAAGRAADRLRLVLTRLAQMAAEPRIVAVPKLVLAEAGNFPELARFYREAVIARGLALVAGIIAGGVASGEFRPVDPELAARLFFAPVLLAALWQTTFTPIEEAPVAPADLLSLHLDLFLRALAAEEARP
jgi:AcrR family transcriptional regulator